MRIPNSANSVATAQGDVPVDDSDGIPVSEHYWQTVSDLAPDITGAAKTILSNKRLYFKKVVAVIAYWETASGLDRLRAQADKLGRLFEDDFKFEVLVYKIPDNVEDWEFISIIGGELRKVSKDRDGLFILYYGGHVTISDTTTRRLWKKENRPRSPQINWSMNMQAIFNASPICSKFFVFDCCHAGGMIDPTLALARQGPARRLPVYWNYTSRECRAHCQWCISWSCRGRCLVKYDVGSNRYLTGAIKRGRSIGSCILVCQGELYININQGRLKI